MNLPGTRVSLKSLLCEPKFDQDCVFSPLSCVGHLPPKPTGEGHHCQSQKSWRLRKKGSWRHLFLLICGQSLCNWQATPLPVRCAPAERAPCRRLRARSHRDHTAVRMWLRVCGAHTQEFSCTIQNQVSYLLKACFSFFFFCFSVYEISSLVYLASVLS